MVLGLYYTTMMREGMPGEGMIFASSTRSSTRWPRASAPAREDHRAPQADRREGNEV
jgi:hypothetical protein